MRRFLPALLLLAGSAAFAQGHGRGHHKDKRDGDSARSDDDERGVIRQWYDERGHSGDLPPGLAKRDQLPPDSKSSFESVALFRLDCGKQLSPVLRTSRGACFPRRLITSMY